MAFIKENATEVGLVLHIGKHVIQWCSRGESLCLRTVRSKRQRVRRLGGAADKGVYYCAYYKHYLLAYFVARCLISCVDNVFALAWCVIFFSVYPQASDVGRAHSLVPRTVIFRNRNSR
jgi:hypothetical protein